MRTTRRALILAAFYSSLALHVGLGAEEYSAETTVWIPEVSDHLDPLGLAVYLPPDGSDFTQPGWDLLNVRASIGQPSGTFVRFSRSAADVIAVQERAVPGLRADTAVTLDEHWLRAVGSFEIGLFLNLSIDELGIERQDVPISASYNIPIGFGFDLVIGFNSGGRSWDQSIAMGSLDRSSAMISTPDVRTHSSPLADVGITFLGGLGAGGIQVNWSMLARYFVDSTAETDGADGGTLAMADAGLLAHGTLALPQTPLRLRRTVREEVELEFDGRLYISGLWGLLKESRSVAELCVPFGANQLTLVSEDTISLAHTTVSINAQSTEGESVPGGVGIEVGGELAFANRDVPFAVHLFAGCPFSPYACSLDGGYGIFDSWSDGLHNGQERSHPGSASTLTAIYERQDGAVGKPGLIGIAAGKSRKTDNPIATIATELDRHALTATLVDLRPQAVVYTGLLWDYLCRGEPAGWSEVEWIGESGNTLDKWDVPRYAITVKEGWPYTLKLVTRGYPQPSLRTFTQFVELPDHSTPERGDVRVFRLAPAASGLRTGLFGKAPSVDAGQAIIEWEPEPSGVRSVYASLKNSRGETMVRIDATVEHWPPTIIANHYIATAGETSAHRLSLTGRAFSLDRLSGPAWLSAGTPQWKLPSGRYHGLPPSGTSMRSTLTLSPPADAEGPVSWSLQANNSPTDSPPTTVTCYVFQPVDIAVAEDVVDAVSGMTLTIPIQLRGTGTTGSSAGACSVEVIGDRGSYADGVLSWSVPMWMTGEQTLTLEATNSVTHHGRSATASDRLDVRVRIYPRVDYAVAVTQGIEQMTAGRERELTVRVSEELSDRDFAYYVDGCGYTLRVYARHGAQSLLLNERVIIQGPRDNRWRDDRMTVRMPLPEQMSQVSSLQVSIEPLVPGADIDSSNNTLDLPIAVAGNIAPVITPPQPVAAIIGQSVSLPECAYDLDGAVVRYRFTLPDASEVVWYPDDPAPEWICAQDAPVQIDVEAMDDSGVSSSATITLAEVHPPRRVGFVLQGPGGGLGGVLITRSQLGQVSDASVLETRDDGASDDNGSDDAGDHDNPLPFPPAANALDQWFELIAPAEASG